LFVEWRLRYNYQQELLGFGFNMSISRHTSICSKMDILKIILDIINSLFHSTCNPKLSLKLLLFTSFYIPIYLHGPLITYGFIHNEIYSLSVLSNLYLIHKLFSPFTRHCIVSKNIVKNFLSYSLVLLSSRL